MDTAIRRATNGVKKFRRDYNETVSLLSVPYMQEMQPSSTDVDARPEPDRLRVICDHGRELCRTAAAAAGTSQVGGAVAD